MADGPLERIGIAIGGRNIAGFSSVSITVSVEQAAREAKLVIADFEGADAVFPGDEAVITANGETMLTGYVGDIDPTHDANSHSVSISIASRTIDAVEASIVHGTGFVKEKNLKEIAEEFDTCGVGIVCDEDFPPEPRSFVNLGASLHQHLLPLARSHGAFIYDTPDGRLRIAKAPRGRHSGSLAIGDGGNILQASGHISEKGRHDEIIVRGQASRGTGDAALRIEARAKDSGVTRRRPKIVVHESEATSAKLQDRATRYARRSAGYSRTASITVAGWRDAGGMLFEPHFIIPVNDPRIYTVQDMGIKSITFSQDTSGGGQGTRATLSLVDPPALNGEGSDGKKQFKTPETKPEIGVGDPPETKTAPPVGGKYV